MPYPRRARFIFAVIATLLAACSDHWPSGPDDTLQSVQSQTILAKPSDGTYTISFLPTGSGLGVILVAYVADASGPADGGSAIFQFCSLQAHPAPGADCDAGSGSWTFWGKAEILAAPPELAGTASMVYGLAPASGTVIGFRFRYLGQGSGIANGLSNSADHTF